MNINKKLLGLGMLLAANGAFAQATGGGSSVELYGIIDLGIGTQQHSFNEDPNFVFGVNPVNVTKTTVNNSVTGLFNGPIQDSRWGIRGTEDLGGGMKAFFTLESGIDAADGNINNAAASLANNSPKQFSTANDSSLSGQLFNRQAFVGISDATLGSVQFGRNYGFIYDALAEYDNVQYADLFSPFGFSGTFESGGITDDTRLDNSVKYKNKIGPVNVGFEYKFGGVAGNSSAESAYGFTIGYNEGPFGIQAAYMNYTDAFKLATSTTAGALALTNLNSEGTFVAAKYNFGALTIKGGFETFTLSPPHDPVANLGVTSVYNFPIATASNFTTANQTTDIWYIGGDYNFTQSLNLSLSYYDVQQKQSDDLKQLQGNSYYYSALLDYHFTKRTDVYGGLMFASFKGAAFPSSVDNTSNSIFAVGIRTKF